jgi:hypothetical protein
MEMSNVSEEHSSLYKRVAETESAVTGLTVAVKGIADSQAQLSQDFKSFMEKASASNKPQIGVIISLCALIFMVGGSLFTVMSSVDNRLETAIIKTTDKVDEQDSVSGLKEIMFSETDANASNITENRDSIATATETIFLHVSDGHPEVQAAQILHIQKDLERINGNMVNKEYLELSREDSKNRIASLEASAGLTEDWKRNHDFRVGGINGVQDERDRIFEERIEVLEAKLEKTNVTFHKLFGKIYTRFDLFHMKQKREVTLGDNF